MNKRNIIHRIPCGYCQQNNKPKDTKDPKPKDSKPKDSKPKDPGIRYPWFASPIPAPGCANNCQHCHDHGFITY